MKNLIIILFGAFIIESSYGAAKLRSGGGNPVTDLNEGAKCAFAPSNPDAAQLVNSGTCWVKTTQGGVCRRIFNSTGGTVLYFIPLRTDAELLSVPADKAADADAGNFWCQP